MSDSGPDLHEIFGIDGAPAEALGADLRRASRRGTDRPCRPGRGLDRAAGRSRLEAYSEQDSGVSAQASVELEPLAEPQWGIDLSEPSEQPTAPEDEAGEPGWSGHHETVAARLLPALPHGRDRRHGPGDPRQVEDAIETSRISGTHARAGSARRAVRSPRTVWHGRWPSATASTTSTWASSSVDMSAANLVATTIAKRYQAVPVAFADKRTLLVAMADPVERPRGRRHRDHDRLRGPCGGRPAG